MDSFEPKKLALLRIWQILQKHSDYDHRPQPFAAERGRNRD